MPIRPTDSANARPSAYPRAVRPATPRSRSSAPPPPPRRFSRLLKHLFLLGLLVGGFVVWSYLGYLDYNVRKQFEGKRWSMPAYVYANPMELYVGYALTAVDFEKLLQRLFYRNDTSLASEGSYYRIDDEFNVRTRKFSFPEQQQESQTVKIKFAAGVISAIVDAGTLAEIAVLRMDPVQIGSFYPSRKEDRVLISLKQAPPTLVQGLIATEDRDYYEHFGVSPRAIARAMLANVKAGGIVQGGSTITQQLIKNFYLTSERSFWRKINEVFMALILEYRYSKDEILEAYLNEVYLGQDGASAVHGFGFASEFYFGRELQDLPLHQVAMLVALVRGPSYYDPRRQEERALNRRNLVLEEMQALGYITEQAMLEAQNSTLDLIPYQHRSSNRYPAFMDLVKRQLGEEYPEDILTSEGLRIFTNLEVQVQDALDKAIEKKIPELEKRTKVEQLQTAALVTRRSNGEIVALAGGNEQQDAGFNRALDAVRPIGSLVKPMVYLTALEYPDRYTVISPLSDTAVEVKLDQGKVWAPHNYDHKEHGVVRLHTALAQSYNLATVRIGRDIGEARIAKTLKNMGIKREIETLPSMLLGSTELTPFEVAQMYQTLAGDGFATPLRAIHAVIDMQGKSLQRYPFTVHQSVDPAATYITNTILQEVMRSGTGKSSYTVLPHDLELVGKTGTTNEGRDSWFAGYSGDFLSVVWVGRDDNKPANLSGATGALPVWIALMRQIAKEPVSLIAPDNVEKIWIDPRNGLVANEHCPGAKLYSFIEGSAPTEQSPCAETTLETEVDNAVEKTESWINDVMSNF